MKIDLDLARSDYTAAMNKLIETYGDPSAIPRDEQFAAGERLRAAYCIHSNPDLPVPQIFKTYSVDQRVWEFFIEDVDAVKFERRLSRADKVSGVLKWATENVGEEVTLDKIMEVGDIAYSMAKKITEDRPDVFRKIKRGLFSVRDPKADREADRKVAEEAEAKKTNDSE
jgi:hypothetical protein